jgi:serine protease AprX
MEDTSTPIRKSVNWGGRATNGPTKSVNWGGRALSLLLALTLVLALVPVLPSWADNDPPRAHPALLQLAAEHPDDTFLVIIQREVKNKDLKDDEPEKAVEKAGGRVKKQLQMIESFSAELTGKEIEKLARHPKVRWISFDAPMISTAAGSDSVRDEFASVAYDGNKGTRKWSMNWTESGESTSASAGLMRAVSSSKCAGGTGNCLRLDPYKPTGIYIYRSVNLSGVASATLSVYRNNELNVNDGSSEEVKLEISSTAGASWTTLRTYSSTAFTGAATDTFDIAAYAGSDTRIRFLISKYQSGYRYIYFDDIQVAYTLPSPFTADVGADRLRSETPSLNGQGIGVAVVDSGIASHTDLQAGGVSRVVASAMFGGHLNTNDDNGHGTHVAGIIGGSGGASSGARIGMAPGVNLINLKVSGVLGYSLTSDVVEALQWVHNNRATYNIRVVNLSLNSLVPESYHASPLDAAVEILWFNGIVVVVSAGNNGLLIPGTLFPPANDPFVITVGAVEDAGTPSLTDDAVAAFSAYGTIEGGVAKPELVAPGRSLVSPLASTNASIYLNYLTHRVNNYYFRMTGTSMSAPVVAGAAALLLQDEPNLTPDQVKYRLMATANTNWPGYDAAKAGAGYLDVYAAVYGTTTQSANTGLAVSQLLTTGADPINSTVNWNSVNWNSVNWNSVNWNSVNWNSAVWDD